jgi:predicted phage tail protein
MSRKIRGAGGGDDESSKPTRAPDSLKSKAFVRLTDLLCEGEIVGLVDGRKSIYLNETPLQNADGSENFSDVQTDTRAGTQGQSYMQGFGSVAQETQVSVEILDYDAGAVVRTISNTNVNRVRLRFMTPAFYFTFDSGTVSGTNAQFDIYVKPHLGSFTWVAQKIITGKASSRYEFEVEIELTGTGPWDVKVLRTPQSTSASYNSFPATALASELIQNHVYLDAITEIIDTKLRYPNSALIGIRIDAEQFPSVPARYYDVKLLKIQVPTNYDPVTRVYTGSWDGTFKTAWSDNPAWVFYDLATNERYGLGAFLGADTVDKWGLYEIGQYCDQMVPDGFGGTEPRFTCNLMLQDRAEAYTLMQNMASIFRGMIYWAGGTVVATQDSPQDPAYLYTPANVMDGRFTYQGASAKARHSVALVTWNDPGDFYRTKVEYVEDQQAIARYGLQQTEITAFGCTSRGQAHRLGKWLLYTEQFESETVTFKTGLEGIVGRPGQMISVADPSRAGVRMGGRMVSATTTVLTVDQVPAGAISGFSLYAMLPNGTVENRTVTSSTGNQITVFPAFSLAPQAQGMWLLRSVDVEPQSFRVIGITEDEPGVFAITAVRHDPDKFDAIESDIVLEPKSYTQLRQITDAPENLKLTESLYQTSTEVRSKLTASWDRVDRATAYLVRYRKDSDNWIDLPETGFNDVEILDTAPGTYTVQVCALNVTRKRSAVTELSADVLGKTAPPVDVSGFSLIPNQGQAYLTWDQAPDLDVLVGGWVRIRHTPLTTGQQWRNAVDIVPAVPGASTSCVAPLLSGTYMVKFLDSSGNFSVAESIIVTTVPNATALNVVHTETDSPAFSGAKSNMAIESLFGYLALASTTLVDSIPSVDGVGNWDFPGDIAASGVYDFQNTVDLGAVYPTRISSTLEVQAFDIGNLIDQRLDNIDDWQDIDGAFIDDVNAELYMRTTEDNPSGTPTWTAWKRVVTGEYSMRGAQFELRCTSGTPTHNIFIKTLAVTLDMPDRSEEFKGLVSGLGLTYRVNYAEPFWEAPSIALSTTAMSSGDTYEISNESVTGFDIVFKNSVGTTVSRTFNVIAKGYGRRVA